MASETFIIGWFADARLGLEAWADAVARRMAIKLPPMPIVYCTWYDNVHGGSGNAKALAELSSFAARTLKPYGFTCVQIDDGWQMGDPKGNGPRKNFSAYNPEGPYPRGMKATADALRGRMVSRRACGSCPSAGLGMIRFCPAPGLVREEGRRQTLRYGLGRHGLGHDPSRRPGFRPGRDPAGRA